MEPLTGSLSDTVKVICTAAETQATHADPEWEYPLFWGRDDETGGGDGLGTSLNLPLPTVIVQKGGYALRALGDLAMRFLRPFS